MMISISSCGDTVIRISEGDRVCTVARFVLSYRSLHHSSRCCKVCASGDVQGDGRGAISFAGFSSLT
ncbi:MAG: hypothetical protein H6572_06135 [Lewinellaceae bacterium]|nr:hypothetical protein [Lewinellaceae bacterium]